MAARRVSLIVNPSSGGGRALRLLPRVEAALSEHGVLFHTQLTRSLEHGADLARAAAGRGEVSVTLSGDGLIGAVAGALADVPDAQMGVLPGGRGNDFARALGLPLDAMEATRVIATGRPRPVDLGRVGDRSFVGIASVGFDSDANRIANGAPDFLGSAVYAYGALRALLTYRLTQFTVVVDGEEHAFLGWTVAAANAPFYGGGMRMAPDARVDDGLLDVVLVVRCSRAHFLRTLPKVFSGRHADDVAVRMLRGSTVEIHAERPMPVYADGDPIGVLPVRIAARPRAVELLQGA